MTSYSLFGLIPIRKPSNVRRLKPETFKPRKARFPQSDRQTAKKGATVKTLEAQPGGRRKEINASLSGYQNKIKKLERISKWISRCFKCISKCGKESLRVTAGCKSKDNGKVAITVTTTQWPSTLSSPIVSGSAEHKQ